jgi:hypothetical protein
VASAGGKISRALKEVQPGATLFCRKNKRFVRNYFLVPKCRSCLVLLLLAELLDCAKKEQKRRIYRYIRLGATYSQETGCTFFTLLHSIRAQGATGSVRCIGWWLSWGNISPKCAGFRFVCKTSSFVCDSSPLLHKNKARA